MLFCLAASSTFKVPMVLTYALSTGFSIVRGTKISAAK